MKLTFATIAAVIALAITGCASSAKAGGSITLNMAGGPITQTEAEDANTLGAAMEAYNARGYAGLAPHISKLRAALDRAPASYPLTEKRPDGSMIVRASDESDGMMLMILAGVAGGDASKNSHVSQAPNVYGTIAMMLGSDAVEHQDYAAAHRYLDRGLDLQPENWMLLTEKSAAFLGERKWREALAIADKALDSEDMMIGMHNDAFLRKRGFALVELGRLVEAREAYAEALKADENDEISKKEIAYIDGLLSGGKPSTPVLISPDKP